MAAVEVGVQQVKHFNTDALILFLSKHGISQTGLKALRGKFPAKNLNIYKNFNLKKTCSIKVLCFNYFMVFSFVLCFSFIFQL